MAGAFAGYFALSVWHLPWYIALVLGMAVGWILGYLVEKVAFRPLRSAGHMPPLLITIGLSIIIRDLAHIFFGAENRPVPSIYEQTFEVAGTQVSVLQVLLLAVAAVLIVILRLLIYGTKIGRAMRATAQDHEAAYAMGVNVNRVFSISFSLASCLGGGSRRHGGYVLQRRLCHYGRFGRAQRICGLHLRRLDQYSRGDFRRANYRDGRKSDRSISCLRLS
jgi:branched-chain amino acid transport system permease protein